MHGSLGTRLQLATTVWMGFTGGEIPMESVHGIAVTGGSFPAEIWRLFMEAGAREHGARRIPRAEALA